jgi:hypothetical protein
VYSGEGGRTKSGEGKRIGNGKIACANKSARETGKPASAQSGAAMVGISGHPAAARVFAK